MKQQELFPIPKKPGLFDGVDSAIERMLAGAVKLRFPDGEPEPKLFSEGFRAALKGYAEYRAAQTVGRVLSGVFHETKAK